MNSTQMKKHIDNRTRIARIKMDHKKFALLPAGRTTNHLKAFRLLHGAHTSGTEMIVH